MALGLIGVGGDSPDALGLNDAAEEMRMEVMTLDFNRTNQLLQRQRGLSCVLSMLAC